MTSPGGEAIGLLVARAPVPGRAKTRLAAGVGADAAADLAAAALLDTIDALGTSFADVHVSFTGDLDEAARGAELRAALSRCEVSQQRGDDFGQRLAHAHACAARDARLVVQVGMDTPQLDAASLAEVVTLAGEHHTVLGPAQDGGWWVLALRDPGLADALPEVTMSTDSTCEETQRALARRGADVRLAARIRDVDDVIDAAAVAAAAPQTRFAAAWQSLPSLPPRPLEVG